MHIVKLANALIPNANPAPEALNGITRVIVGLFAKWYGGLWVGGQIEVSKKGFLFSPNELNRKMHLHLADVFLPLSDLLSAEHEFGLVTGVVAVRHLRGVFKFRCFDAKAVAAQISELIVRHGNGA